MKSDFEVSSELKKKKKIKTLVEENFYEDSLMADIKLEDGSGFRNFVMMTFSGFKESLETAGSNILRSNGEYRAPIPASIRLEVVLQILALNHSRFEMEKSEILVRDSSLILDNLTLFC
ncbi:unnamed protein product [Xylocopa violacea]|uniref:Uncharacterized protein n=1 Tax=Xylocopa violacea TaxID=135666 RepID=A0ABP1NL47_XYLVO